MKKYNYTNFKAAHYDLASFPGPKAGEKFIDMDLFDLNGNKVKLSDYLDKPLVAETGSITCPMYTGCISTMEKMSEQFPELNFILVYVREAHPGERTREHQSIKNKLNNAKQVKTLYGDNRTILVDDIDGGFHMTYGPLPNIIYIIDTDGTVLYRGDWNNPEKIPRILETVESKTIHSEKHVVPKAPLTHLTFRTFLQGGFRALWDLVLTVGKLKRKHKNANENYERIEASQS